MKLESDSPKIIYLHPDVRGTILKEYPEIEGIVSDSIGPDTVMVVDPTVSEVRVERDDNLAVGTLTMHVPAFHLVLNSLRRFIDKYKQGATVRNALLEMIEGISNGYRKEAHESRQVH